MRNVYLKQIDVWLCEDTSVGIAVMNVKYE